MHRCLLLALLAALLPRPAAAQAVPDTDVFLMALPQRHDEPRVGAVTNLTDRPGYDNQPSWLGDATILYTAQRADGQTDIAHYRLRDTQRDWTIDTPTSEYSPTLSHDGESISVVRVELDSTQRLWSFPLFGGDPRPVLPDVKPVGYFAWLDAHRLALFVLGQPNTLRIGDTRTGKALVAASDIGRSILRVPGTVSASFLHRVGSSWILKIVHPTPDPDGGFRIDSVAVMPDSADYIAWRSASELYTGVGSRLLRFRIDQGRWSLIADLSPYGIRGISRLAISPDGSMIAVVAEEPLPERR